MCVCVCECTVCVCVCVFAHCTKVMFLSVQKKTEEQAYV